MSIYRIVGIGLLIVGGFSFEHFLLIYLQIRQSPAVVGKLGISVIYRKIGLVRLKNYQR